MSPGRRERRSHVAFLRPVLSDSGALSITAKRSGKQPRLLKRKNSVAAYRDGILLSLFFKARVIFIIANCEQRPEDPRVFI